MGPSWRVLAAVLAAAMPFGWGLGEGSLRYVAFATAISMGGGLAAALVPAERNDSWSWQHFARLITLGALVGPPTAFALHDPRSQFLGDGKHWVIFGVGMLAYPIVRGLRRTGPAKLLWGIVLKMRPPEGK